MSKFTKILFNCIVLALLCFCGAGCKNCGVQVDPSESSSNGGVTYTITYDLGVLKNNPNATITSTTQSVSYGETLALYTPACEGYTFVCWKVDGEDEPFTATTYLFEEGITLVAEWKALYTITYHLGELEGQASIPVTTQMVYYGESFALQTPSSTTHKFIGWTVQEDDTPFDATVYPYEKNITLVATWKKTYYITYHLGELENNPDAILIERTQAVYFEEGIELSTPRVKNHKFVCWKEEGSSIAFDLESYPYEKDITLVAVWEHPYVITYDLGELADNPDVKINGLTQKVYYGDIFLLKQPTCKGYEFLGWKIEGEDGYYTDLIYELQEDITLVAVWKIRDYTGYH